MNEPARGGGGGRVTSWRAREAGGKALRRRVGIIGARRVERSPRGRVGADRAKEAGVGRQQRLVLARGAEEAGRGRGVGLVGAGGAEGAGERSLGGLEGARGAWEARGEAGGAGVGAWRARAAHRAVAGVSCIANAGGGSGGRGAAKRARRAVGQVGPAGQRLEGVGWARGAGVRPSEGLVGAGRTEDALAGGPGGARGAGDADAERGVGRGVEGLLLALRAVKDDHVGGGGGEEGAGEAEHADGWDGASVADARVVRRAWVGGDRVEKARRGGRSGGEERVVLAGHALAEREERVRDGVGVGGAVGEGAAGRAGVAWRARDGGGVGGVERALEDDGVVAGRVRGLRVDSVDEEDEIQKERGRGRVGGERVEAGVGGVGPRAEVREGGRAGDGLGADGGEKRRQVSAGGEGAVAVEGGEGEVERDVEGGVGVAEAVAGRAGGSDGTVARAGLVRAQGTSDAWLAHDVGYVGAWGEHVGRGRAGGARGARAAVEELALGALDPVHGDIVADE